MLLGRKLLQLTVASLGKFVRQKLERIERWRRLGGDDQERKCCRKVRGIHDDGVLRKACQFCFSFLQFPDCFGNS